MVSNAEAEADAAAARKAAGLGPGARRGDSSREEAEAPAISAKPSVRCLPGSAAYILPIYCLYAAYNAYCLLPVLPVYRQLPRGMAAPCQHPPCLACACACARPLLAPVGTVRKQPSDGA